MSKRLLDALGKPLVAHSLERCELFLSHGQPIIPIPVYSSEYMAPSTGLCAECPVEGRHDGMYTERDLGFRMEVHMEESRYLEAGKQAGTRSGGTGVTLCAAD